MPDLVSASKAAARRVLLTGASSGIGAALARELAKRGDSLWLGARRADRLDVLVAEIQAAGSKARALTLDVADVSACRDAVLRVDDEAGGLDVVIANAGIGGDSLSVWTTEVEDAARVIGTNFSGALATLLPLLPRMKARGRGHIVGMSSLAAEVPVPLGAVYGASKAGFTFWLDAVAPELQAHGIAVTIVHPGFVRSEMTAHNRFPMPFMQETDVAARRIANAIDGRRAWLRFPLVHALSMSVGARLPRGLRAAIARAGGAG